MKKAIQHSVSLILLALTLAMLTCVLAACGGGKVDLSALDEGARADAIFDIASQKPSHTYAVDTTETLIGTVYGIRTEAEIYSNSCYVRTDSRSPIVHLEYDMEMKMISGNVTQTDERKEVLGYRDGKMYSMRKFDGESVSLASQLGYDDYVAHEESMRESTEEEFMAAAKSASVKTTQRTDGGGWVLELSGYSEENLELLIDNQFDMIVCRYEGYRPVDMKLTMEIDKRQRPIKKTCTLVFERTDAASDGDDDYVEPVATYTSTVRDIGRAEAPSVDLSKYKKVDDLRVLDRMQKQLSDLTSADNLEFTADKSIQVNMGGELSAGEITCTTKIQDRDGAYTFTMTQVEAPNTKDETVYEIAYENGKYSISGKGIPSQTVTMSENEARLMVDQTMDPASFTSSLVSDIKGGSGDFDYVFTLASPDYSAYEQKYSQYGAENFEAVGTVSVKLKDGAISDYRYVFKLTFTMNGETVTEEDCIDVHFGPGVGGSTASLPDGTPTV